MQKSKLELEFDELYDSFYSDTKINNLKNDMKKKLFDEFREFFTIQKFIIKTNHESNKYLGNLEIITATIGNYKVVMSISDSYTILLKIQHKNNFEMTEYRVSMDISSENQFMSFIRYNTNNNIQEFIELKEKDIKKLTEIIAENKDFSIVCKFDDGQSQDINKEYKTFKDIIEDIPEK